MLKASKIWQTLGKSAGLDGGWTIEKEKA